MSSHGKSRTVGGAFFLVIAFAVYLLAQSSGGHRSTSSSSSCPATFTATGGLAAVRLAVPSAPVVACYGECAGGTWSYKVAALDGNGFPTTGSAAGSATSATTLTPTDKNVITCVG